MESNKKLDQIEYEYLLADFDHKLGRISRNRFNKVVVNTLLSLIEGFGTVEPYYTDFKRSSESQLKPGCKEPVRPMA